MEFDIENAQERERVYLFLDESGTSYGDALTLVGATAFHDAPAAERVIKAAYDRTLGDASIWRQPEKRRKFAESGFHFTEDSESVRNVFVDTLSHLDFRAYVAYGTNDPSQDVTSRLITMYGPFFQAFSPDIARRSSPLSSRRTRRWTHCTGSYGMP